MTVEIPAAQSVRNQNRLSSKADLEILSSFPKKKMNTKVGWNFVLYNQDTGFALFGVQTWEIWCRQGRAANQENLDETDFMESKFPFLPRKISCKARWSTHQGSQGHKYTPLGAQGGVINPSIHQRAAETKEKHREEAVGCRESSNCLRDGLGHALAAMVGPAWWSHGGVPEPRLEFVKSFVPSRFSDVTISSHTLIYYELCLFICVATICL
jgi:hypothetical protein